MTAEGHSLVDSMTFPSQLLGHTDVVVVMDNEALDDICRRILAIGRIVRRGWP